MLYSPKFGYNLFSPSAEFDGESWNGRGDGVMTAFQGQVTFQNFDGRLVATAYCLGEDYWYGVGCPHSYKPSALNHDGCEGVPQHLCSFARGIASYHCKQLGTELVGDMHACTGCSMSKAMRKGISHETKRTSDKKLGRVFVDLGGRKNVASVGSKHYFMIVTNDFTRRAWIYFLGNKSDAGACECAC